MQKNDLSQDELLQSVLIDEKKKLIKKDLETYWSLFRSNKGDYVAAMKALKAVTGRTIPYTEVFSHEPDLVEPQETQKGNYVDSLSQGFCGSSLSSRLNGDGTRRKVPNLWL